MAQEPKAKVSELEQDIFREAQPAPQKGKRVFLLLAGFLLVLWWAFGGAKIRPRELIEGIPQIAITLGRMLPPDFSKVIDAKSYFLPGGIPLTKLLLPLPVSEEQESQAEVVGQYLPPDDCGGHHRNRPDGINRHFSSSPTWV